MPKELPPQFEHAPAARHTAHTARPRSATIGPRHCAHFAGSPHDRHTRATPYPRRDTTSAADPALFSNAASRPERSSASAGVVSTSGAAARSSARGGLETAIVPRSMAAAVSTDGEIEARTHAAPSSRARAMATSRTW